MPKDIGISGRVCGDISCRSGSALDLRECRFCARRYEGSNSQRRRDPLTVGAFPRIHRGHFLPASGRLSPTSMFAANSTLLSLVALYVSLDADRHPLPFQNARILCHFAAQKDALSCSPHMHFKLGVASSEHRIRVLRTSDSFLL